MDSPYKEDALVTPSTGSNTESFVKTRAAGYHVFTATVVPQRRRQWQYFTKKHKSIKYFQTFTENSFSSNNKSRFSNMSTTFVHKKM